MSRITEICVQVRDEFLREDAETAYDINCGLCEDFAMEVIERHGGDAAEQWIEDINPDYPNHCVIDLDGRYYDAECVEGVDSIDNLPCVLNQNKTRAEVLALRQL